MLNDNFRDVGLIVNQFLQQKIMREGWLFRSGANVSSAAIQKREVHRVCLKLAKPYRHPHGVRHIGISPDLDCYDITAPVQSQWLFEVLKDISSVVDLQPVHLFCHSGTDRTGVVIASVLYHCNVPQSVILQEYGLSAGSKAKDIARTLTKLEEAVFDLEVIETIRSAFLHPTN